MSNYWIFPVFIPNYGCPQRCAFCDQSAVTGESTHFPETADLEVLFTKVWFSGKRAKDAALVRQIAFYGGNFTGLPRDTQRRYLDWAAKKVAQGLVHSIRFSTRPDALGKDEIAFLKGYPVHTVEIGVQSLSDAVLAGVRRGHTALEAREAVYRVRDAGWETGVQLMPGLPGETMNGFLDGVRNIADWKVQYARLYPTVVLEGTRLARDFEAGTYVPLTLKEAVTWCAAACRILESAGIEVIRLGLPASPGLESAVMAGPYHPAFGFLVQSFRFHEGICEMIRALPRDARKLRVHLSSSDLSRFLGHRRASWKALCETFPDKEIDYVTDCAVGEVSIERV